MRKNNNKNNYWRTKQENIMKSDKIFEIICLHNGMGKLLLSVLKLNRFKELYVATTLYT